MEPTQNQSRSEELSLEWLVKNVFNSNLKTDFLRYQQAGLLLYTPQIPPEVILASFNSHSQNNSKPILYICDLGARFEREHASEHSNRRD